MQEIKKEKCFKNMNKLLIPNFNNIPFLHVSMSSLGRDYVISQGSRNVGK